MKLFKRFISLAAAAVTAVSASALPAMAAATPDKVDYNETENNWAKLLQYTLYFYDANMCGTDVEDNNLLAWRGNCHTYDSKVPMQPIDDNHTGTNMSASFMKQYKDILLRQFILFAEFLYIPRITVDISGEVDHVDSPHISTF